MVFVNRWMYPRQLRHSDGGDSFALVQVREECLQLYRLSFSGAVRSAGSRQGGLPRGGLPRRLARVVVSSEERRAGFDLFSPTVLGIVARLATVLGPSKVTAGEDVKCDDSYQATAAFWHSEEGCRVGGSSSWKKEAIIKTWRVREGL